MRTNRHTEFADTPENLEHLEIGIPPVEVQKSTLLLDKRVVTVSFLVLISFLGFWFSQAQPQIRHDFSVLVDQFRDFITVKISWPFRITHFNA